MKKLLLLSLCLINMTCFAAKPDAIQMKALAVNCGHATPTGDPTFCATFKAVAYCHCNTEHGIPSVVCNNMTLVYNLMTSMYGTIWDACSARAQKDVPQQECFDNWNFYRAHCA